MPHLALPRLTSYLHSHGVEVVQRDLNVETFDTILTRAYLAQAVAQVESAVSVIVATPFSAAPPACAPFRRWPRAWKWLHCPSTRLRSTFRRITSWPPANRSRDLLQAVRDPQHNTFLDLFRRGIIADLEREQPNLVGISIPTLEQMLAGLTLAYLIKGLVCGLEDPVKRGMRRAGGLNSLEQN